MHSDRPADLGADTAVRPVGEGRYLATLPPSWDFFAPSGGVLTTIALRAMQAEASGFRPMASTTTFVRAVPSGPLVVEVTRLREGNVATQLRAALRHADSDGVGLEVTATFVRDREGPEVGTSELPDDARSWDDAPPLFAPNARPRLSFFRQVEGRIAIGAPVFTSARFDPGPARYARWFRYLVPQRVEGRFDALALPPLVDTMPAALVMAVGSAHPPIFMPSLDLTVHYLAETTHDRLLCVSNCRSASKGYASCDIELRDPDGVLVAFGTQTMIVRRQPA
ncbi:MAG: thioesterase family protein [Polyangiales bacterium]